MQIGDDRVSTQDHDFSLQLATLQESRCDKIYDDIASGANASHDGLKLSFEMLREDDCQFVWILDHLGRSVKDRVANYASRSSAGQRPMSCYSPKPPLFFLSIQHRG